MQVGTVPTRGRDRLFDYSQAEVDFMSEIGRLTSRDDTKKSPRRLRDDGLEMMLIVEPEETRRWVEDAPLRLVAAAVVDVGRRTKTSDLKDKLSPAVISDYSWRSWWPRVQNALKTSPHFDYDSRKGTRLKVPAAQVDSVSLGELLPPPRSTQASMRKPSPATRLVDWVTWMQADKAGPMPTGVSGPPDALVQIIEKMATVVTPRVVDRLAGAVEERVVLAAKPPKATPLYLECLVAGLYRMSELHEATVVPLRRIVVLSVRLVETLDRDDCEAIVSWLADYASKGGDNIAMVANAILQVSREIPDGTQRLVSMVHASLNAPARIELWQQLLASSPGQADRPPVEQWLRNLTFEERCAVESALLVVVQGDNADLQIDSMLSTLWKLASANQRHQLFDAIALRWLLHAQLLPGAETIVQEVAESFDRNGQGNVDSLVSEPWKKMIQSAARREVERVRKDKDDQTSDLRGQLKDAEAELERMRRQTRHFQSELQNATHRAALEVSGNAIEVLGSTLQDLAVRSTPMSTDISDVKAMMELALRTLNAELFGEIDEVEPYDPGLHETNHAPTIGTAVRVTAPGVRYKIAKDKSRVMIKKRTQPEVQL